MLKMFSAAVLAASLLAAPALAAGPGKTVPSHNTQRQIHGQIHGQVLSHGVLNAKAQMRHRHHDVRHHDVRHHDVRRHVARHHDRHHGLGSVARR